MPHNPDAINSLRRLGLNQYEAKSYFALCTTGKSTAGELAERAEVARPRVYDVLRALQEKGFVAVKQGRPIEYVALPLEEAVKTIKRQRHESLAQELTKIDELGSQLAGKLSLAQAGSKASVEEAVWMLKGREAIYSKLGAMIEGSRRHVMISGTANGVARHFSEHGKLLEKAKSRGVKVHLVSQLDRQKAAEFSRIAKVYNQSLPTRMVLADDQALLFLTPSGTEPTEEVGVWLNAPHVAETLRQAVRE